MLVDGCIFTKELFELGIRIKLAALVINGWNAITVQSRASLFVSCPGEVNSYPHFVLVSVSVLLISAQFYFGVYYVGKSFELLF